MATERQNRLAAAMSALSYRIFTGFEIAIIEGCVISEYKQRKIEGISINNKLLSGRKIIRERTAALVNERLNTGNQVNEEHILRFKRVLADDYTERTGKCAWGFKEVRKRWGYDPDTGREIDDGSEC